MERPTEDDGLRALQEQRRPLRWLGVAIATIWIGLTVIGLVRWKLL